MCDCSCDTPHINGVGSNCNVQRCLQGWKHPGNPEWYWYKYTGMDEPFDCASSNRGAYRPNSNKKACVEFGRLVQAKIMSIISFSCFRLLANHAFLPSKTRNSGRWVSRSRTSTYASIVVQADVGLDTNQSSLFCGNVTGNQFLQVFRAFRCVPMSFVYHCDR